MEGARREEVNDWNPMTHLGRDRLQKAPAGAKISQEIEQEPETCRGAEQTVQIDGTG